MPWLAVVFFVSGSAINQFCVLLLLGGVYLAIVHSIETDGTPHSGWLGVVGAKSLFRISRTKRSSELLAGFYDYTDHLCTLLTTLASSPL